MKVIFSFEKGKGKIFFQISSSNHHILDKVYACPLLKRKAECMNNLDINQMHVGKLILKSEYEHIFLLPPKAAPPL